jgi:hypothetical protein
MSEVYQKLTRIYPSSIIRTLYAHNKWGHNNNRGRYDVDEGRIAHWDAETGLGIIEDTLGNSYYFTEQALEIPGYIPKKGDVVLYERIMLGDRPSSAVRVSKKAVQ